MLFPFGDHRGARSVEVRDCLSHLRNVAAIRVPDMHRPAGAVRQAGLLDDHELLVVGRPRRHGLLGRCRRELRDVSAVRIHGEHVAPVAVGAHSHERDAFLFQLSRAASAECRRWRGRDGNGGLGCVVAGGKHDRHDGERAQKVAARDSGIEKATHWNVTSRVWFRMPASSAGPFDPRRELQVHIARATDAANAIERQQDGLTAGVSLCANRLRRR